MKKIVAIIILTIFLFTACSSDNLGNYQKAIETTREISKGKSNTSYRMDVEFNTEGLSIEEIRDLSYYNVIQGEEATTFDMDSEKLISRNYFNFSGIGFDTIFYKNGGDIYLDIPVIEGYVRIDDMEEFSNKNFNEEVFTEITSRVVDKWKALLSEEDVLKGSKTYILTDEGQIKTTTYSIEADEEQLKILCRELVAIVQEEQLIEAFIIELDQEGLDESEIDLEEIEDYMYDMINRIKIESFQGMAYVDFDGRLVKQTFKTTINIEDAKVKEPKTITGELTTEFTELGKDQIFSFPEVDEDDWIKFDEDTNFETLFSGKVF